MLKSNCNKRLVIGKWLYKFKRMIHFWFIANSFLRWNMVFLVCKSRSSTTFIPKTINLYIIIQVHEVHSQIVSQNMYHGVDIQRTEISFIRAINSLSLCYCKICFIKQVQLNRKFTLSKAKKFILHCLLLPKAEQGLCETWLCR